VRRRWVVGFAVAAVVLVGCGDDGGEGDADAELVELLREEAGQPEAIATCIAGRLEDADVDRDELVSIIRGEGSTDIDTSNAYGDAAFACVQESVGEVPGLPDLSDQLSS
jgi:hypothetical protein